MRSRYRINENHATYFITSTIVAWLPVFTTATRCNILIEALEYCRAHKGLKIHVWVILDNHFHAVLTAPDLQRVLADVKRHTAQKSSTKSKKKNATGCSTSSNIFAPSTNQKADIKYGRKERIHRRSAAMK